MTAKKEAVTRKSAGPKKEPGPRKEAHQKSRLYDSFQEEIANTYFKTSDSGKRASKKKASKLPWAIALIAVFIAAAIFVSKSNFDIKVRVLTGTPFITKDGAVPASDGAQFLIRGGEADSSLVAKAFFVGDARAASSMAPGEVTLSNSKAQGWASFIIEMKSPVDLTRTDIRYIAKGASGSEKLFPVVVDSQNRSYRIEDSSLAALADGWHTYIIGFKPVKVDIDLSSISLVKFEFGSDTAGNGPGAKMFLKDVSITKARRIKWL